MITGAETTTCFQVLLQLLTDYSSAKMVIIICLFSMGGVFFTSKTTEQTHIHFAVNAGNETFNF
jgi:hypothetical protein